LLVGSLVRSFVNMCLRPAYLENGWRWRLGYNGSYGTLTEKLMGYGESNSHVPDDVT